MLSLLMYNNFNRKILQPNEFPDFLTVNNLLFCAGLSIIYFLIQFFDNICINSFLSPSVEYLLSVNKYTCGDYEKIK